MSEPVTNVEIEDVLSSIRRLVSAEERGTRSAEQIDDSEYSDDDDPRQAANKLVLTPAQRVEESLKTETAEAGDAAAEAAEYEIDLPERHGVDAGLDGVEDAEVLEDPAPAEAPAPGVETAQEATEATEATARGDIDIRELEARIAGFEAAVAQQDDEWEPDGSTDDDLLTAKPGTLPWQHEAETAASGDDAPETAGQDSAETPPPGDGVSSDASAETSDDPPDMSEGISGAQAGPKAGPESSGDAEPATEWYADDAFLDEDALRDMVSEIVRQELQGELGERITRNVRKLVRREIHRALLSQGIE